MVVSQARSTLERGRQARAWPLNQSTKPSQSDASCTSFCKLYFRAIQRRTALRTMSIALVASNREAVPSLSPGLARLPWGPMVIYHPTATRLCHLVEKKQNASISLRRLHTPCLLYEKP